MENNDDKEWWITIKLLLSKGLPGRLSQKGQSNFCYHRLPKCEMKHVLKRFSHTDLNITQYSSTEYTSSIHTFLIL